jgi:hypothetical protein
MEALYHSDTPWLDVLAAKFMVVNDLVSLMHELNFSEVAASDS